jgi:hypothetical protein
MSYGRSVSRITGGALLAAALVPWALAGTASAAVTVYVDAKWDGTNSATVDITHAACDYTELAGVTHDGVGWHFVLPGGTGLTEFSANFADAGVITVTTTNTADGAVVQDGKGAVVYTPGDDVLESISDFADHPGQGSAATAGENDMQLSHLCTGETPPVTTPPETTPVTTTPVTTTPVTTTPVSTPPESTPPETIITTTAPETVPTTAPVTSSVSPSVLGTKTGLPVTGNRLPLLSVIAISAALVLAGLALLALPGHVAVERHRRKH